MDQIPEIRGRETNLYEVVDLLWRRKWLIAACLVGVVAPIMVANITTPPVYQAHTTIIFEQGREPLPALDYSNPFYMPRSSYIINQIEEIKSRALAEEVVRQLDSASVSALLGPRRMEQSSEALRRGLVERIKGSIAAEPVRESDVLMIRVQGPTPTAAAAIANVVGRVIRERNTTLRREQASSTRKFIEDQLPTVEANLSKSEEAIKTFKSSNQIISLSDEAREILSRVTSADNSATQAVTERQGIEQRLAAIEEQLRAQGGRVETEIGTGSIADGLRKSLTDLQMEATQLSVKGYGPEHPQMVRLSTQIESTKAKLAQELKKLTQEKILSPMPQIEELLAQIPPLQIDLVTAQARERALKTILANYESALGKLPSKELQLARLLRAKDVGENLYKMLLEKYEEAKITEAGKIGNVRVIDPAMPPGGPIKPRKSLNLAIGLIVGLTLGVGLAFFLESLDNSIKSPEELEHQFKLTVLGLIPAIHAADVSAKAKANGEDEVASISATIVTKYSPRSPISEAYRTLRTNIQFSRIDNPLKTAVVSSSVPSEGKSTTVANLAITTALTGTRTLLVDADLRRPVIHSLFGLEREPGLINLLAERLPMEKVIRASGVEHLDILTCGAIPPNPSELLGSQRMMELIDALKARYDLVLFDSPPVLTVTDTAVLGSRLEGVILVVLSHATDRRALKRAMDLLNNVKAQTVGAVLNRIEVSSFLGSYDYYYHYQYYYYMDEEGRQKRKRHRGRWR